MDDLISFSYICCDAPRLDAFLIALVGKALPEGITRSQIQNWIRSGFVTVNGEPAAKTGKALRQYDRVTIDSDVIGYYCTNQIEADQMSLDILFEDEHLIVLNKPAGLTVHPGAGHARGTLLNGVVAHLGRAPFVTADYNRASGVQFRPGIVHRLDKDTSGLMLVAKNLSTHVRLSEKFASREISRQYHALAFTTPRAKRVLNLKQSGRIETYLARDPRNRLRMAVVESDGKFSATNWTVLERFRYGTYLDLKLDTGRTHQIRVHLKHIGSQIIGDPVYGDDSKLPRVLQKAAERFGRQALHAFKLDFTHPVSDEKMNFEISDPTDMIALVDEFRRYSDEV
ncbi:MAG: RluA family pseudouridine synthase [Bdellovibrionales bacterium]|nr:RluA family pseudouridine synthase [Bdellovibrionales bacterium]